MMAPLSPLLLLLLCPVLALALTTLPEVFQSFPFTDPSLIALSAQAVAVDPSGDVFVAGVASPSVLANFTHTAPTARTVTRSHLSVETPTYPKPRDDTTAKYSRPHRPRHVALTAPTVFIARISSTGTKVWLHVLPSNGTASVDELLLHAGHVFVFGTSTASVAGSMRTTAPGTPSVYAAKYSRDGRPAWPAPVMFGSAGADDLRAVTLDRTRYFPHIFISGRVGGNAFPAPVRAGADLHAWDKRQRAARDAMTVRATAGNGSAVDVLAEMQKEDQRRRNATIGTDADLFVVKLDPSSGALTDAVQLPLARDNSADALAVHDGVIYVAVNSFDGAPFDPAGTSALYAFRARDLAFRAVHAPSSYSRSGDYMQAMAADAAGNIYIGGFSLRGHRMDSGVYVLRKYSVEDRAFEWEKELGRHTKIEPKVSLAVGRASGNVFVSGHTTGLYVNADAGNGEGGGKSSSRSLLRLPLTVFSAEGRELISWDRTSPYPVGYEEIAAITLDKDENVVYAGKWLNPDDGLYDAIVGSFGANSFTARAADMENGGISGVKGNKKGGGMGAATIGLICLAAGVGLVVVGAAVGMGRSRHLGKKGVVYGGSYDSEADDADDVLDRLEARTGFASLSGSDENGLATPTIGSAQNDVGGSAGPV